jgi:aspartate carbamoyltransferase catalytic subunit
MSSITNVVSMKSFSREEIDAILDLSLSFENVARGIQESHLLGGKVLATLFYEPSTRTRLSFESAMIRLGGSVLSVADMRGTSSVWKGESLADTIRTVQNYADVIALRHPEAGAAATAAKHAGVPVLNAGDDANEHPTQALLDLLTIRRERGCIDGLTITVVGDHAHSRVTNSLAYGLANYDVNLILVSPPSLAVSRDVVSYVRGRGVSVEETDSLEQALQKTDVVYIFRIQKERFTDPKEYERLRGSYHLDRSTLERVGREITVMHPMPRIDELSLEVDVLPGACYFRQSFNGVLVRMALLSLVLGKARL